jgi:hypothetical protein
MIDERVRGVAVRLGLREIRCPDCFKGRVYDGGCCERCGGTGRLWLGMGSQALPDCRLERLA